MEPRLRRKHYLLIVALALLLVAGVVNREFLADKAQTVSLSLSLRSAEARAKGIGLTMPSDEGRGLEVDGLLPYDEFDRLLRMDEDVLQRVSTAVSVEDVFYAVENDEALRSAMTQAVESDGEIFDFPFARGMDTGEPNFGPLKNAVKVLVATAAYQTQKGDLDSARGHYETVLSIGEKLASDPGFASVSTWNSILMAMLRQIIVDLTIHHRDERYVDMVKDLLSGAELEYDFVETSRRQIMRHIQTAREFHEMEPDLQITLFSARIEYVAPPTGLFVEGALLSQTLRHWVDSFKIITDESKPIMHRGYAVDQRGYEWSESSRTSDYMGKTFPYVFGYAAIAIERTRQMRNLALVLAEAIDHRNRNGQLPSTGSFTSPHLFNSVLGEPMSYSLLGNTILVEPSMNMAGRNVAAFRDGLAWVQESGYALRVNLQ